MSELKKYFQKKNLNIKRVYITSKLDRAIQLSQKMLETKYVKKYGKRKKLTYQATTEAVADRIVELLNNGRW